MESAIRLAKARKNLQVADHMVSVTYPLLQEPRLLLTILDNIFLAYVHSMTALLEFEYENKHRESIPGELQDKFDIFRRTHLDRYHLDKSLPETIQELKELVLCHKRSPVEFRRRDEFVICSENYDIKKLSIRQMQRYIAKAKLFIDRLSSVIE
ncbi:hypothetical protein H6504_03130 [Candidatus Woesearchaeota archaeon]|nr:hypothetical protein [Candidatus Woesearchaeota archaeon]